MKDEMDITGGFSTKKPTIEFNSSGEEENKKYIRYIDFGKYRVGFIEDENHQVIGIKSIEIIGNLYNDDQISKKFNYWDVEEYYK